MIDEENVNQAIYDYAYEKYGEESLELFLRYIDEFEKNPIRARSGLDVQ